VRTPSPRITLPNGLLWDSMGFHGCQRIEVGFRGVERDDAGERGPPAGVSALKGRPAAARCANAKRGCAPQTKRAGRHGMAWEGKTPEHRHCLVGCVPTQLCLFISDGWLRHLIKMHGYKKRYC